MKRIKRICILLMFVLLTGCCESALVANAASAWSFRTGSGKRIAVGDILQMKKDEYQNINLYKNGKEIKESNKTYSVTWSSSNETVLWINPGSGQCRADKFALMSETTGIATVTATIQNRKSGAVAKRSFIVNVTTDDTEKDEANDVSKDETQSTHSEPTPTITPTAVSLKQIRPDTVEVVLANKSLAQKMLNNKQLINVHYLLGDIEFTADIFDVAQKEDDEHTLVIRFYSPLRENTKYYFRYNTTEYKTDFTTSDTVPYQLVFSSMTAEEGKPTPMNVTVYNNEGVDISEYISNELIFEPIGNYDFSSFYIDGNLIEFNEAGKSATIRATLDMGYDNAGNEKKDITATARVTSIAKTKPSYTSTGAFAVAGSEAASYPEGLDYSAKLPTLFVGDTNLYPYIKITGPSEDNTVETGYIVMGSDTFGNSGYTYQVVGQSGIVMINSYTGEIKPVYEGTTTIAVLDENNKGIARIPVTVLKEQKIANFVVNAPSAQLSAGSVDIDEYCFKTEVYDQVGNRITDHPSVYYTYEVESPTNSPDFDSIFTVDDSDNGSVRISPAYSIQSYISPGYSKKFTIKISAVLGESKIDKRINVTVKNVTGISVAKTELVVDKTSVDMKLTEDAVTDYDVRIVVKNTDSAGYLISYENISLISTAAEAKTSATDYSVLIKKSGSDTMEVEVDQLGYALVFKPVTGNSEITKAKIGNYSVQLYQKNTSNAGATQKGGKTITLTDSTAPITATVKSNRINGIDNDSLTAALGFKSGTVDIDNYVRIVDVEETMVNNNYYIQSVTLAVDACLINPAWKNGEYTEVKVNIGRLFVLN